MTKTKENTTETKIPDFPTEEGPKINLDNKKKLSITELTGTNILIEEAHILPTEYGQSALLLLAKDEYVWGGQVIVDQIKTMETLGYTFPRRAKVLKIKSKTGHDYYKLAPAGV